MVNKGNKDKTLSPYEDIKKKPYQKPQLKKYKSIARRVIASP